MKDSTNEFLHLIITMIVIFFWYRIVYAYDLYNCFFYFMYNFCKKNVFFYNYFN